MSRGISKFKKRKLDLDPIYNSVQVSKMINYIMWGGKKTIAQKIVYSALEKLEQMSKGRAIESFNKAIDNASPMVEVRSKRIGGATYQVPMEISEKRRQTLALKWIIGFARNKKGKPMAEKLALELFDAYNNQGLSVKKKEDTHKMADANRAFAHFARM